MSIIRRINILSAVPKIRAVKPWQGGNKRRIYFNFMDRAHTSYIEKGQHDDWKLVPADVTDRVAIKSAMQEWLQQNLPHKSPTFIHIWEKVGGVPLTTQTTAPAKSEPQPIKKPIDKPTQTTQQEIFQPKVRNLTTEQYKEELAKLLQTTVKNLPARMGGVKIGTTCPRCGGSGNYSFNQTDGTRCFQCRGPGIIMPKTALQWELAIEDAKKATKDKRLTNYLDYLQARKEGKKATDQIMAAWTATKVAELIKKQPHWQREGRDEALDQANHRMSVAYQKISELTLSSQYGFADRQDKLKHPGIDAETRKRQAVLELAQELPKALKEIADAEAWYKKQKSKG